MSKETAMAMINPGAAPAQPNGALPAATPEAPPAQGTTDPRIQALLKKETTLVRERETFNRQKQEWEPRVKQADEILAKGKLFEETLAKDPIEALRLIGFNETQIFNAMAQANEKPKEKTPQEIAQEETNRILKERDEADAKARAEQIKVSNDQAVRSSIKNLVTTPEHADKYEYLNKAGEIAQELVRETLFQFAADVDPKTIDQSLAEKLLGEAADAVEEYYRGQAKDFVSTKYMETVLKEMGWSKAEAQAMAAAATEAIQEAAPPAPVATAAPEPPRSKTLTSRMTTTATTGQKPESRAEKRARLEKSLATGDKSLLRA